LLIMLYLSLANLETPGEYEKVTHSEFRKQSSDFFLIFAVLASEGIQHHPFFGPHT
jgi:hypothetical protein